MLVRTLLLPVLICLVAVACGDDGATPGGGADTEWLDEGSGAASTEPLEPLIVGTRRTDGGNLGVFDAVVERDGRRFVRYQLDKNPDVEPGATLLFQAERGVELWHSSEDGWLETPILFVPNEVRVGMRWRARYDGKPLYEYEVTTRAMERTTAGERMVWTIQQTNLTDDYVIVRRYIEGVGLTELQDVNGFRHTSFARPLDEPTATIRPALAATPITPLAMETNLIDNLRITSVSMVRGAGDSTGTLIVKGWRGCAVEGGRCAVDLCFQADGAQAINDGNFATLDLYHRGTACAIQRFSGFTPAFADDATGALVTPTDVYWVPRSRHGGVTETSPFALYADPATLEPRMIVPAVDGRNRLADVAWDEYATTQVASYHGGRSLVGQWALPQSLVGTLAHRSDEVTGEPAIALSLAPPGQPPQFAWIGASKLLMHSTLTGDVLSTPRPVAMLTGRPAVTTDERGQQLLLASPDGSIDRIVAADGTLVREAIGRVELPAGEVLMSAIDLTGARSGDGRLLITTYRPGATVPFGLGDTRMYTTALQPPVRWALPAATGVTGSDRGKDVVVCWPATPEPLVTTGWTIGGVPAREVLALTDTCALVVRDLVADPILAGRDVSVLATQDARTLLSSLSFHTEGPVPGVGRISLGVTGPSSPDIDVHPMGGRTFAALTGGGYTSGDRLWTAGGIEEAVPRHAAPQAAFERLAADRQGAGLWMPTRFGTVQLGNRDSQIFDDPVEATDGRPYDHFASPGGGLVAQYPTATGVRWFHLAATGTWTALPAPPTGATIFAQRANGELCGSLATGEAFCMSAAGAITATTPAAVPQAQGRWTDLEDGSFLLEASTGGVYRFDPAAQSVTVWDATATLEGARHDHEGRAYGVMIDTTGTRIGGRFAPSGFVPIDLTEWKQRYYRVHVFHQQLVSLVPGPDRLWVVAFGCQSGVCGGLASPIGWP